MIEQRLFSLVYPVGGKRDPKHFFFGIFMIKLKRGFKRGGNIEIGIF